MARKSASTSLSSTSTTTGASAAAAQPALEPKRARAKSTVRVRKSSTKATQSAAATNGHEASSYEITRDDIAHLAYTFWEQRGFEGGSPEEDWLRAEQELRGRISSAA